MPVLPVSRTLCVCADIIVWSAASRVEESEWGIAGNLLKLLLCDVVRLQEVLLRSLKFKVRLLTLSLTHTLMFYWSDLCVPVCRVLLSLSRPWVKVMTSQGRLTTLPEHLPYLSCFSFCFLSLRSSCERSTGGHGSFREESVFGSLVKVKPYSQICLKLVSSPKNLNDKSSDQIIKRQLRGWNAI